MTISPFPRPLPARDHTVPMCTCPGPHTRDSQCVVHGDEDDDG